MATPNEHPPFPRRLSWIAKYSSKPAIKEKEKDSLSILPSPTEGQELIITPTTPTPVYNTPIPLITPVASIATSVIGVPFRRSETLDSSSLSRPTTPKRGSSSVSSSSLTNASDPSIQLLDKEASQLILNALERTNSAQPAPSPSPRPSEMTARGTGSFGKMAFSSMMGGLSALSLSRTSTNNSTATLDDKEIRGRTAAQDNRARSSSAFRAESETSRSRSRARSQSPFTFRRFRQRDSSPTPQPLPLAPSDLDLSDYSSSVRPRTAFTDDPESGDETTGETDFETEDEDWSGDDLFDTVTERNTERNALIEPVVGADETGGLTGDADVDVDPDPLGEGVNVVVPQEPYFPSTLNSGGGSGSLRGKRNPRRRKSTKHEPLRLETSRPVFKRDRCTITLTQGDPDGTIGNRRIRRYVVASDMSEESRYAVEWGIGTVIRDGDEMLIVTVVENESKVDPPIPNASDRAVKLRSQQERQGLAYILARQATSLLQRTKLNVTVSCQAWHAKNSRHMLLDIVDYNEPMMLIVGSRGLGQLKGILLGSTSHYLIQKCSVPVMVARRRLKRPPKHSAHLAKHRTHVSLAEAGIDRVAPRVDQDVKVMRDEIQRDNDRREGIGATGRREGIEEGEEGEEEDGEGDDGPSDAKVAG